MTEPQPSARRQKLDHNISVIIRKLPEVSLVNRATYDEIPTHDEQWDVAQVGGSEPSSFVRMSCRIEAPKLTVAVGWRDQHSH